MVSCDETALGEYTRDGTVDLRGNPVLRSKRGGWKACSFVVVYEVFERMAFYGISSNLILYLTNKLHEGLVTASNNVTNWVGAIWMMPILGAYIADAHLGRYWTFIISSVIYLLGMCILTLAVSIPSLKPPPCGVGTADPRCVGKASQLQLRVFFTGLYTIALGTGGTKPNISTIGADQFDVFDPKERAHKLSFFNWWMFSIFLGTLFATTILVYVQDNVGWSIGYALPTFGLAISIVVFVVGTPFYRHKMPAGSPFTRMAQVFVAAMRKWRVSFPFDPKDLYELGLEEYQQQGKFPIGYTPSMSILSKAAVMTGPSTSLWYLCPVTQVEEAKQMLRMIPILAATFIPSIMYAQASTIFVKQGATLDRRIGPGNFRIPPASILAFNTASMLVSIVIYDRLFVPFARRRTGKPRGISLLQRMGIGFFINITIMITASVTERYRLAVAHKHGVIESGDAVPLTIFILLPQLVLLGIADAFLEVGKIEFFYDQAPEGMKSLGTSYYMTSFGVGSYLSSFLLKTTEGVTKRDGGRRGWILNNLNKSHLDYYYAFFAVLNILNFVFFLVVSRLYVYRSEVFGREVNEKNASNNGNGDVAQKI